MVSKESFQIYIANTGTSREERMWNSVDQIQTILKDLEEKQEAINEIHLSNNSIGLEVSEALAKRISCLKNLQNVGYNDIYVSRLKSEIPKSLTGLIEAIQDKNIIVLNLSDNAFGPSGVSAFDFYLKTNTTLKELYLENNGLGPEGASSVALALKSNPNIHLERLRIGRNRLENKGATAFGEYFSQTNTLLEVVAFQNGIKEEGIKNFLTGLLSNEKLEILKINDNTFGDSSVDALLELLNKLKNLKVIDISDSKLGGPNSIKIFEKLVKISSIKEIYCNYNEIEEKEDQLEIYEILSKVESKLKKLEIKGNEIKKSVFKKIKTHQKLADAEVYSESEMEADELSELMKGISLKD